MCYLSVIAVLTGLFAEMPVPPELRQAFHQRNDYRSISMSFVISEVEHGGAEKIRHFEALAVREDLMLVDRGDADGIRLHRDLEERRPALGVYGACHPQYHLFRREPLETWSRYDGPGWVGLAEGGISAIHEDPRFIGVAPWSAQNLSPSEQLDRLMRLDVRKWEVEHRGNLLAVIGWLSRDDSSGYAYEWLLDPSADMAIVEVATIKKSAEIRRSILARHEYQKVGENWWPKRSFITNYGRGIRRTVEYSDVKINDKNHPRSLTPESMGVPLGAVVRVAGAGTGGERRYAGSGRTMSPEEFERKRSSLDLSAYERYQEAQRVMGPGYYPSWWEDSSGRLGVKDVEAKPDSWEVYVRRWKLRHTEKSSHPLGWRQIHAADSALKDCRRRARNLVDSGGDSDTAKLNEQIARIFEELKQRLGVILTTEQQSTESTGRAASKAGD
ncbi:MAG: hypothetical protein KF841_11340 [Phycisphaerae bacterium]|nr:hypothetical protein [Phycisphaerae bacterium]